MGIKASNGSHIEHYRGRVHCSVTSNVQHNSIYEFGEWCISDPQYRIQCSRVQFKHKWSTPNTTVDLYEDNSGALEFAKVPKMHPQTKHIALDYHHFWEHIRDSQVWIHVIDTHKQMMDMFTKALPKTHSSIYGLSSVGSNSDCISWENVRFLHGTLNVTIIYVTQMWWDK